MERTDRYNVSPPAPWAARASFPCLRWTLQCGADVNDDPPRSREGRRNNKGATPMNQLRARLAVSSVFLLAALFGTAPPVHAQDAWRATPPPGKTLMFVFRSEREAVAARVPVFVNSVRVGELANGSFVIATVNPGRVLLRVGEQTAPTYAFDAAANQSYFARVAALAGVQPVRTEVRLVREAEARPVLAQSRFLGAATVAAGAPQAPAPAPRPQPPEAAVAAAPRVEPAARPAARA